MNSICKNDGEKKKKQAPDRSEYEKRQHNQNECENESERPRREPN